MVHPLDTMESSVRTGAGTAREFDKILHSRNNSNIQLNNSTNRGNIETRNTNIHEQSCSWTGGVKLVSWDRNFTLSEMI